jgi:hypothetical protein
MGGQPTFKVLVKVAAETLLLTDKHGKNPELIVVRLRNDSSYNTIAMRQPDK